MANHFTVFLTERDSNDLKDLQIEVENWRDLAVNFNKKAEEIYDRMRRNMSVIEQFFRDWVKLITDTLIYTDFAGSRRINQPDMTIIDNIIDDSEKIKRKIEAFLTCFEDNDSIYCHG